MTVSNFWFRFNPFAKAFLDTRDRPQPQSLPSPALRSLSLTSTASSQGSAATVQAIQTQAQVQQFHQHQQQNVVGQHGYNFYGSNGQQLPFVKEEDEAVAAVAASAASYIPNHWPQDLTATMHHGGYMDYYHHGAAAAAGHQFAAAGGFQSDQFHHHQQLQTHENTGSPSPTCSASPGSNSPPRYHDVNLGFNFAAAAAASYYGNQHCHQLFTSASQPPNCDMTAYATTTTEASVSSVGENGTMAAMVAFPTPPNDSLTNFAQVDIKPEPPASASGLHSPASPIDNNDNGAIIVPEAAAATSNDGEWIGESPPTPPNAVATPVS